MLDFAAAREAMVDRQVRPSDVTRYGIVDAMLRVPRERFVPTSRRPVAYADEALEMTEGRWLLEPRTFAKMLDAAEIGADEAVLDVGCGLGYSTAVLSRVARAVIAVEADPTMAAAAEQALQREGCDNAAVLEGPLAEGAPSEAPFDAILVEGAVAREPGTLLGQLAEGGRLVAIWREGAHGHARVWVRAGDATSSRWAFDAAAPVLPGFEAARAFAF